MYKLAGDHVISKLIDDEVTVINLASGYYYAIEGVGAQVWLAAQAGYSKDEVVSAVISRFPEADAAADVKALLSELEAADLIKQTNASPSSVTRDAIDWPSSYAAPNLVAYDDVSEMVALDPPLPELPH